MKIFEKRPATQVSNGLRFDPPPTPANRKRKWRPRFGFRYWTWPRLMFVLIVLEYPLTVAALALTGIADPDTYRTKLWKDGSDNGFNSDPSTPLYAAANHQPVVIPLVWGSFLTKYNLVIVVLSMFILLTKSCMISVAFLYPIIALFIHLLEVGLYGYSVYGQSSSDLIDPDHQVHGPPWYITKSCNVAFRKSDVGYCKQAKGQFVVMCLLLALFCIWVILSVQSVTWAPNRKPGDEDKGFFGRKSISKASASAYLEPERQWEMVRIPETPGTAGGLKSPVTPRTRAFNDLEGGYAPPPRNDLPLREKSGLFR